MNRDFPEGFVFGASTAAYQIEGAWNADGKGEGIWDRFCRTPGAVAGGDTGEIACDHYRRWAEDLDLAQAANMTAYRFSLNWTRILPEGTGQVNAAGLDFYDRLVDGCLARGLAPWPCLYHWDYAQALQDRGGWAAAAAPDWYGELAQAATRRLGDRAKTWVLFNEPSMFTALGYLMGVHAPGLIDPGAYGASVRNVNRATARGAALVRAAVPDAQVGTVVALNHARPASDAAADAAAAARADAIMNASFLDPLFHGRYPAALADLVGADAPAGEGRADIDFLGINHYTRSFVAADAASPAGFRFTAGPGRPARTAMGWEIHPEGMYEAIARIARDYRAIPIYVTENGGAFPDVAGPDGRVHDADRIGLLHGYLRETARAVADGHDVRGYLVWSLLDNFEWAHGYAKRFGLIHVDYATLKRTPKASYHWYARLAREGRLPPPSAD